jgi:DNA polymerase-3 subunit epsilon
MFDNLFGWNKPHIETPIVEPLRWVMLDTETTGLNAWLDDVISIAAVGIHLEPGFKCPRIVFADSFEVIIKPEKVKLKRPNVLIHHIGVGAQEGGYDHREALELFRAWVGDAPLLAFMAPFDQAMLKRSYKKAGLPPLANEWLDVEPLAGWVAKDTYRYALDERIEQFGLECVARHTAAADTFVTAELLLKLLPRITPTADTWAKIKQLGRDRPQ